MLLFEMGGDPPGEFPAFIVRVVPLIREYHETVIRLAADDPSHALRRLSHRVERKKIRLFDLERLAKILQPRAEYSGESVLVRDAVHDYRASVVPVEVDALGDFAARDAQEHGASAAVTRSPVVVERQAGLHHVLGLDEH